MPVRALLRALAVSCCALVGTGALAAPPAAAAPAVPSTVVGQGAFPARLTTRPGRIVLGRTGAAVFHIQAPEPPGALRPLRASVNVGTLGKVRRLSPGEYEVAYTPPKPRYPQVAIVAIWFETGPEAPVAFFRVSLLGSARVPVKTVPRARVTARVAGRRFGPFRANRHGRAVLRLVVPPGVPEATITARNRRGKRTSRTLALHVPPYNRLTLALVPHTIVADGVSRARLHLYFDAVGGHLPKPGDFQVKAPVGTVGTVAHDTGPVFGATYTASPGTPDQTVAFTAEVQNDPKSHAAARISLGRQTPARVAVAASPGHLVADGQAGVRVTVTVLDALGLGVPGLKPKLALGAGLRATAMSEVGKGVYRARVTPRRLGPKDTAHTVAITATVGSLAGRTHLRLEPYKPATLTVDPRGVSLTADGEEVVILHVHVLDAEGHTMPGLAPTASARLGEVATPAPDGKGAWAVRYRVPRISVTVAGGVGGAHGRRGDTVTVQAGALTRTVDVRLHPAVNVLHQPSAFVELTGGYRNNLGRLGGPYGSLALGLKVGGSATSQVSVGVVWGVGQSQGQFSLPDGATASSRLFVTPLLAEVRLSLRGVHWLFSAGLGAGVVLLPGDVTLPASGDIPIHDTLFGAGARLAVGWRLGPGYLLLEGSYLYATRTGSGAIDVTGSVGGPAAAFGYRLEL